MSTAVRIFHNPRCSKSREALALLRERGIEPEIVEYLKDPPDEATLTELARALGGAPHQLLRTKESAYDASGLSQGSSLGDIVRAIVAQPVLLERPIVVVGEHAVIGRPTERIAALLELA